MSKLSRANQLLLSCALSFLGLPILWFVIAAWLVLSGAGSTDAWISSVFVVRLVFAAFWAFPVVVLAGIILTLTRRAHAHALKYYIFFQLGWFLLLGLLSLMRE